MLREARRAPKGPQRRLAAVPGVVALSSGAALVIHIIARVSLLRALLVMGVLAALGFGWLWRKQRPDQRAIVVRRAKVGVFVGTLATLTYDVSKFALSRLDPSPYNPFEVINTFGVLLAGAYANVGVVYAAGAAFHLLNGISFGVSYSFLLGHRGAWAGIMWGLLLELFQLTLYPGWLDIRFYREFVQISAASHIIYGAVLGILCQRALLVQIEELGAARTPI